MTTRQGSLHVVILAGLLGGGIAIATVAHDATAIIGLALLGAPLGAWFVLYDQVMLQERAGLLVPDGRRCRARRLCAASPRSARTGPR